MKAAIVLVLSLLAGPVQALSCLSPNPVADFVRARDAVEAYAVIKGNLSMTLAPESLGESRRGKRPLGAQGKAFVEGKAITRTGFQAPFQAQITVNVTCISEWCGHAPEDGEALMFLRRDRGIYVLEMSACGGNYYPEPARAQLAPVVTCHATGDCPTLEFD